MPKSRRKSSLILIFFALFGVIILVIFSFLIFSNYQRSPLDPNGKVKMFIVNPGQNPQDIAKKLEHEGFIRSPVFFMQEFKSKKVTNIQAGDYKLSPAMSVSEIIKTLQKGSVDRRITLLEGWRKEEIAKKLKKELGIEENEFLALSEEGYMFPDTYFFNPDATGDTVVGTLKATFNQRFNAELQQMIQQKGLTVEQGVIVASLVEREARTDKVRTEVAGIILKRLKMGMKLDIDATVQYAKDSLTLKKQGKIDKFWQPITQEDYSQVKSPYNTYLNAGLPPGPICNPSLSSLKAVANASPNTPYLFYYHDLEGNTYYAKTLEEHTRNVSLHR